MGSYTAWLSLDSTARAVSLFSGCITPSLVVPAGRPDSLRRQGYHASPYSSNRHHKHGQRLLRPDHTTGSPGLWSGLVWHKLSSSRTTVTSCSSSTTVGVGRFQRMTTVL